MRIAVGSDHAGFELKSHLAGRLAAAGHEILDAGPGDDRSVDYPDHAAPAARMVGQADAEAGVLVCGSGVGVAMVANKVAGVRAVCAHDVEEAELSRRHNDANVVTLSGRRLAPGTADAIVEAFLATDFDGGRHARRVEKISALDKEAART